jgi:uncharacterized protein (TIGR00255 family)
MIKSMTGFASLTHEDEHATVEVTLRSVNHRFLDLQIRLPHWLAAFEARVRGVLQRGLSRGRVEAAVSVQERRASAPTVELDVDFIASLATALDKARDRGLVDGPLTPADVLRIPQALAIRDRAIDTAPEEVARIGLSVEVAVELAVGELDAMRIREGDHLRADLDGRRNALASMIARVAELADAGRRQVEARLTERVHELGLELPVDQALIAQEVVRAAGRSDISEEVTRFGAHLAHWEALSSGDEPCGRKLDFLLQEMNREVNTIGSKADGLHVSEVVINLKAELEKMREQVQNVE